ncbi:basic proline-rich protein-like [Cygnus atratus]|uniref:basic proline-rich protein-like n=1 Tax=Cygnus atratus TaxID=8868 RepID=UPI0021B71114|nr:basic proline-rich protein-like [Cygnus atratus]
MGITAPKATAKTQASVVTEVLANGAHGLNTPWDEKGNTITTQYTGGTCEGREEEPHAGQANSRVTAGSESPLAPQLSGLLEPGAGRAELVGQDGALGRLARSSGPGRGLRKVSGVRAAVRGDPARPPSHGPAPRPAAASRPEPRRWAPLGPARPGLSPGPSRRCPALPGRSGPGRAAEAARSPAPPAPLARAPPAVTHPAPLRAAPPADEGPRRPRRKGRQGSRERAPASPGPAARAPAPGSGSSAWRRRPRARSPRRRAPTGPAAHVTALFTGRRARRRAGARPVRAPPLGVLGPGPRPQHPRRGWGRGNGARPGGGPRRATGLRWVSDGASRARRLWGGGGQGCSDLGGPGSSDHRII